MNDSPTPAITSADADAAARAAMGDIARRLAGGANPDHIVASMVEQGYTRDEAAGIVGHVNIQYRQAMAKAGRKRILIGFLWAAGGGAVTAFTYLSSTNGGTYVVAWGAMIFGVYDMIRGLIVWMRFR
jgi:hypothetical protein